jgi:hypothetical protein
LVYFCENFSSGAQTNFIGAVFRTTLCSLKFVLKHFEVRLVLEFVEGGGTGQIELLDVKA